MNQLQCGRSSAFSARFECVLGRWVWASFVGIAVLSSAVHARAQTLRPRFSQERVFSGLGRPTAVQFSPDGRVLVAEQSGLIRIYSSLEDRSASTFLDLRTAVYGDWDRGLLGMVLHPDFPEEPYVYVMYTFDAPPGEDPPFWSDRCTGDNCVVQGRISRFEVTGDQATGPEEVFVQNWCQQYPSHSIGSLAFGEDGALYATAGDGASFTNVDYGQFGFPANPCGDPPGDVGTQLSPPNAEGGALRSQDIRTLATGDRAVAFNGSVLRMDPETGEALPDNPLYGGDVSGDDRIIAYGLRNPFRFTVQPGTGRLWISDVGWNIWEEINVVENPLDDVIENFGWPCYEGAPKQGGYDAYNLSMCESLYTENSATPPFFAYSHAQQVVPADGCAPGTSAVSGIAFYEGDDYPDMYQGAAFFGDYARNCIWAMLPEEPGGEPDKDRIEPFITQASSPVDLKIGPGGDLFYVDINAGSVWRVRYAANNQPPLAMITADPTNGEARLTVQFDASKSSDLDPGDSITYAWDLDDDGQFDDSTAVRVEHTFDDVGVHDVSLRVTDETGVFSTTSVPIYVGRSLPNATILTPRASTTWNVGDLITFSGRATDDDEGTLPATSLSWEIILHHCALNLTCHEHRLTGVSGTASGSFTAPDHSYPSEIEIRLTATDSEGLIDTASVTLVPETVTFSFDSVPSGLTLSMGSEVATTPFMREVIVGSTLAITAPSPQISEGLTYTFASWSNGETRAHVIDSVSEGMSLTATFMRRCGNGQIDADEEECDDRNANDGDCCSASCKLDNEGTACMMDADDCSPGMCDATGTCVVATTDGEEPGECCTTDDECDDDDDCTLDRCVERCTHLPDPERASDEACAGYGEDDLGGGGCAVSAADTDAQLPASTILFVLLFLITRRSRRANQRD